MTGTVTIRCQHNGEFAVWHVELDGDIVETLESRREAGESARELCRSCGCEFDAENSD